ncbi:protein of unknown function [Streptomyces sp. KY75]|nr:protein of unknown function [Streptomyces sp. KY70]CAD5995532.1 protein of unknown function [Streptomyces sp. KY75]
MAVSRRASPGGTVPWTAVWTSQSPSTALARNIVAGLTPASLARLSLVSHPSVRDGLPAKSRAMASRTCVRVSVSAPLLLEVARSEDAAGWPGEVAREGAESRRTYAARCALAEAQDTVHRPGLGAGAAAECRAGGRDGSGERRGRGRRQVAGGPGGVCRPGAGADGRRRAGRR